MYSMYIYPSSPKLNLVPFDLKAALDDKPFDMNVEYCLARDYPGLNGLDIPITRRLVRRKGFT